MAVETANLESLAPKTIQEIQSLNPNTRVNIRSSNLALPKTFSEREKDLFQTEAFEFFAVFFENSLEELSKRNNGIESDFRRVDANRFTTKIYKNGGAVSQCTIFIGNQNSFGGICYTSLSIKDSNLMNESLQVGIDENSFYLENVGFGKFGTINTSKLTKEGGAEHYYAILIATL